MKHQPGFMVMAFCLGTRLKPEVQMRIDVVQLAKGVVCHRCPGCGSVGTFRNYPAISAEEATETLGRPLGPAPARWLCKWCGWWWSPEHGVKLCVPDGRDRVWMWKDRASDPEPTPLERFLAGDPGWWKWLQITL